MKKRVVAGVLFFFLFSISHGIGLQHGLFRSQSTQGEQWMGTATIISEHFDITVYPDYLDVEMDWVFEVGGTEPDSFENALEIVGNLNLEDNSVIVSMLVWYKDMILKAKLKRNSVAREEYEAVVERDSDAPPPPRDPVLLEMIRDDNYDISIFPVEFGGTRKVRIRYLVPGKTVDGVIKIGYTHAFTENATVAVKKGPGVAGYRLESTEILPILYDNSEFEELSGADFSFKPYGGSSGGERLSYIIPVVDPVPEGSRLFVGEFSTETFSGTMAHLSIPSSSDIILKSSLEEDYVILWRWNSLDVLRLYTRQIVEQASLLKSFFSVLNESSKRGALVISQQGGEVRTFKLDSRGGDVYTEMLEYLTELSELAVSDEGIVSSSNLTDEELQDLADKSFEEFKTALETAVGLFDERDAEKFVLILTAGPNTVTQYDVNYPEISAEDITVGVFSSLFPSGMNGYSIQRQSWPGVELPIVPVETDTSLKIFACLTNGTQVDSFQTNASGYRAPVADRFVYSDKPLSQEITWKIYRNEELLGEFTETPTVTVYEDGLQYARLVGSLKFMMPMSETMPTSLASTLGFIDMKYTLLALEEDALEPDVAALYEQSGVPLLTTADIFPDTEEKPAIPVADWLAENPREDPEMPWIIIPNVRGDIAFDDFTMGGGGLEENAAGGMQWGNPQADVIEAPIIGGIVESYSIAPVEQKGVQIEKTGMSLQLRHGWLELNLGNQSILSTDAELVLYDLKGRVIMRISLRELLSAGGLRSIRLRLPNLHSGTYLVRLEKSGVRFSRSVVIR
jgi:hypothetical protein